MVVVALVVVIVAVVVVVIVAVVEVVVVIAVGAAAAEAASVVARQPDFPLHRALHKPLQPKDHLDPSRRSLLVVRLRAPDNTSDSTSQEQA